MRKLFNNWLYYGLERDEYKKCVKTLFPKNISGLCMSNTVMVALTAIFAIFPIITENNYVKASFYFSATAVALVLLIISIKKQKQYKQNKQISNKFIYILIVLYYANVMFFGMYLAVWAKPEKIAGSFIGIIICALFPLNISPLFYFLLTISVVLIYIPSIILFKIPSVWNYDIQNALFAVTISLIFGWQLIMNRMTNTSTMSKLEDENTIDALTQLKNRRDFMKRFERCLQHNRPADNFLCIALLDIDCFKNYNDLYGHHQGDECLKTVGKTLGGLHNSMGIYAARVGGEEFALLWHREDASDTKEIGSKLNQIIRDLNIPNEKSIVAPYITISIGIHIAKCGLSHDIKDLYNLADKALYAAKGKGRNCTVIN